MVNNNRERRLPRNFPVHRFVVRTLLKINNLIRRKKWTHRDVLVLFTHYTSSHLTHKNKQYFWHLYGAIIFIWLSISIKKCYPIFFYHLKKQFYYLYHTILQFLPHPKTLFLLKYYYLIFRYYFFLSDIA